MAAKENAEAIFKCSERDFQMSVQCKTSMKMNDIFKSFASKVFSEVDDFEFYYKGNPINGNSEFKKLSKSATIEINVNKKQKILKCPDCICNNCVILMKDYKLYYYGCCHNHKSQYIRKLEDYKAIQQIDLDRIKCHKCQKTQKKCLEDFYKCFNCSAICGSATYFCKDCIDGCKKKKHTCIKYDQKYYYCPKKGHYGEFKSYCENCKSNLCKECEKESNHQKHELKQFNQMFNTIDLQSIKDDLRNIKGKIEDLKTQVQKIINMMNDTISIMEIYCNIAQDIMNKYEATYIKLNNFQNIKSITHLLKSNKEVMADLDGIVQGNQTKEDWVKKCGTLIGMYYDKINIYLTGSQLSIGNLNWIEDFEKELSKSNGNISIQN